MLAPDVRLCFAGDSFVAGVGDESAHGWVGRVASRALGLGANLTAYNLGVRRETTAEVAARLPIEAPPRLRDGDVAGVVFSTGVNDTTMDDDATRTSSAHSLTALRATLDYCARHGWPVLVVGPPPIDDELQNHRIEQLSAAMERVCAIASRPFVSAFRPLVADAVWRSAVRAGDGAHPDAAGYERLAELIWPAFHPWLTGFGALPADGGIAGSPLRPA